MSKFYVLTFFLLTSCAAMKEQWIAANCSTDAAYSKGVEDAQNGAKHEMHSYSVCPNNQGAIKRSYSKGYTSVKSNPMNMIKDMIGMNHYSCVLSPFVDKYEGSGRTMGKAKARAKRKCLQKHDEMHCDDFECTKS